MLHISLITDMITINLNLPYNCYKHVEKGNIMNCWESLHIQLLQQQRLLIDEQRVNDLNPLYSLAITMHHTTHNEYLINPH